VTYTVDRFDGMVITRTRFC